MNITKILAGLLVLLAVVLAGLAWLLGSQPSRPVAPPTPASAPQPAAESAQLHAVVVAARAVAAGQRIGGDDIKLAHLPAPVQGGFTHADDVLGRTTLMALSPGTPFFEQQLLSGLALQLEPGQRAVAIAVREQMAAGNHVRPGDFVDVYFTLDGRSDQAPVDAQTRLLMARSRVLAYGAGSVERPPMPTAQRQPQQEQESGASSSRRFNTREDMGQRPENVQSAVLAVPLDDVERLTLAEKFGQLTLALRNPDDQALPDPSLFAALPTALQPTAGRLRKDQALLGSDRAFAGLRLQDLATGADPRNIRKPMAAAPMTAQAPAVRQPRAPRQHTVELHNGAAVQMVNY
ncbi:Flp pilus assembly protein CpaB [Delftia tsuruhatensis]|uniref:Flp pilus assembly protein CpaB n=1 Tax=Delftia tsuruhatensis TaxID=180282 RepID=UPI001E6C10AC|nr:Flp pilus assembly protein CpaB [Delftia tsuruhatensis]CAB5685061.1 Flp pilus assembly protein CpaB [Delftia tsuruhatensis]CAC9690064.1 Flp pilus assembly protein CpaB [Delftia tsuruhatensis]